MGSLSKALDQLSKLSSMINATRQHSLFSSVSNMITGTGTFLKNQAELIQMYCGSNLKQYMTEHDSMRELFKEREVVRGAYVRKE